MTRPVNNAEAVARHGAAIGEAFAQSSAVIAALATDAALIAALAVATDTSIDALTTIALCGNKGSLGDACDVALRTPSSRTPHIQEGHIIIGHTLCALIEREMRARGPG